MDAKTKWIRSVNYPWPAPWYHGAHSPALHFALTAYDYIVAGMAGHPADEAMDADPDLLRRTRDAYVLAALANNEAPKKVKRRKSEEDTKEDPVTLCGVAISWPVELPRLKVWAGQMSLATIIAPRLAAVRSAAAHEFILTQSLFDFCAGMRDEKTNTPIGAAGLDPRGIVDAIDAGFSPTSLGMAVAQWPAVDLLAIIGLQLAPITRIAWDEYGYAASAGPWDNKDAWRFKIGARAGGYLRAFGLAEKWRDGAPSLPVPGAGSIREHIIALAKKRDMTAYAIALETKRGGECLVSDDHVKAFLSGEKDMTSERLDAVLEVLRFNEK